MANPNQTDPSQQPRPPRPARPNYAKLHVKPLPLDTHPLPAFLPQNPLSILRIAYAILSVYFTKPTSHPAPHNYRAYYSAATRSVHVTDELTARALWESGFFGKGSLSRSEPEWLEREKRRLGLLGKTGNETSAEVTRKRREERREGKRERARLEREELEEQLRREGKLASISIVDVSTATDGKGTEPDSQPNEQHEPSAPQPPVASHKLSEQVSRELIAHSHTLESQSGQILENHEHLQLIPYEAFFLTYGLGILDIYDPATRQPLGNHDLLKLFRHTSIFPPIPSSVTAPLDDPFVVNYVAYHHFRSLGWVVRPGVKFSVDLLLYNRGPVFSHAEFAVLVVPDYGRARYTEFDGQRQVKSASEKNEWWWLHAANRVQGQVKKTLVIAYVEIPPLELLDDNKDIGAFLRQYTVKEFIVRRWTANRNR